MKMIIGIAAAVVVIGAGAYFLLKPAHDSAPTGAHPTTESTGTTESGSMGTIGTTPTGQTTTQPASNEGGTFSGSIHDLAGRSGSWKCVVQSGTIQSISAGTVHVSGGKVRGDFTSNVSGYGAMESHMIADGTYVYTWTSAYPTGFKSKMTAAPQGGTQTSGQGFDANANYRYDCQPETADPSLFVVPANITFSSTD